MELERIALEDDYFVKRKLYPNVDFYSGIIYQAMGFKPEMFTVLFAIPRTVGWLAQWQEMLHRPRAEDRPSAAGLSRLRRARLRRDREEEGTGEQDCNCRLAARERSLAGQCDLSTDLDRDGSVSEDQGGPAPLEKESAVMAPKRRGESTLSKLATKL